MEASRPPPTWLVGWRHMVSYLLRAELTLVKFMLQTVRLRLRPRSWIARCDLGHQQLTTGILEQLVAPWKDIAHREVHVPGAQATTQDRKIPKAALWLEGRAASAGPGGDRQDASRGRRDRPEWPNSCSRAVSP